MALRSRIVGTGGYVPPRVVSNAELARLTGMSPSAIYRRTGIQERRWVGPEEATSHLAQRAALAALEAAGVTPQALDAIILSTTSPDTPMPASACHVQRLLGAKQAFAFDLAASCSGFLYALSVGDHLIRQGQARRVLIAAAEVKSRFLDYKEPSTAILFGDGAGAAVLAPGDGRHGVLSVTLRSDGSHAELIQIRAGGSRLPPSEKTVAERLHTIHMRGPSLFRVAVRRLETAGAEKVENHRPTLADVQLFIFHQAHGRVLGKVRKRLGIRSAGMFSLIEHYGHTSSSSLPLTLDAAVRAGQGKAGDLGCLATVGGGVNRGAAPIPG